MAYHPGPSALGWDPDRDAGATASTLARTGPSFGVVAIAHGFVCAVVVFLAATLRADPVAADSLIRPMSLLTVALFVWTLGSWRLVSGTIFDP